MGASGGEGRHVKPEETGAEGRAEEKAADPQVKYPGGQTGATGGTSADPAVKYPGDQTGATGGTSAGGDDEEQVKYPG